MGENGRRILLGKVFFRGNIILKTGLHIGGSQEAMQIGGIDLPVIKDSANNIPYIPGSSLKGKLRSTLEKYGKRIKNGQEEKLLSNRNIGTFRNKVFIHCCEDISNALNCEVCRVFGSSGDDRAVPKGEKAENFPSLLLVRDCLLDESFLQTDRVHTEIKMETGLDRSTMAANPRRVERVLPDTTFNFEMIYSVESIALTGKSKIEFIEKNLETDLKNILTCLDIIQNEGLGGFSSRGYGKVNFALTEFNGKSLEYFKGNLDKIKGRSGPPFSIQEARKEIDSIVNFFREESQNVISD